MPDSDIQSDAFRRAALRSERWRVGGLLVALAAGLLIAVIRFFAVGTEVQLAIFPRMLALLGGLAVYELAMLTVFDRAIRFDRQLPAWAWPTNLFIETLFPTLALLILTESAFVGPFKALLAPVGLIYFFFIILSTMRLSPALSGLTGLFSAIGYLAVTAYSYVRYADVGPAASLFPFQIYATYAVMLLLGGGIAGAVAGKVRGHVTAALREAETRRRAERMEHDLEIARSIQRGLLPEQPPPVDGFEIAGWNQPADETGGDYYDWQELPDGRVVISLADVTGHGIGPALVTAACRAYSRASVPASADLGSGMSRVNQLLSEDLPRGKLVTFVVAVLDRVGSRVELLSAGHGPLFLYTVEDDRVQNFKAHGIPLGVSAGIPYGPAQELRMAPGDLLVLITDGFFEWENPDREQFGVERLEATIRAASELPPHEIIARLHSEVLTFAGGTAQQDDLTAVVVKATGA